VNTHALAVLEYPRALELVAGFASSSLGAARVRALVPRVDREALEREHARVAAVRAAVGGDEPWHPDPIPDLETALTRLRVVGSVWSAEELRACMTLLRSSRHTQAVLREERRPAVVRAVLGPLLNQLVALPGLEAAIDRVVADDATVKDSASAALRRIRTELRAAQGELVRILERALARLEPHLRVADMSVTVRGGRYVIPVRREGRSSVGGIVHDSSASGNTLFVEPPAAVEFGNRMRELEADELEEVKRILAELTDTVRPHRDELVGALDALAELDSLYARARFAAAYACGGTTLVSARDGFLVRVGRHPLLIAQGREVVPFDLEMAPGERTLLVSGPNTGGKTVLLKALGLLSMLAQSGIPAPAAAESRIPVYDDVFADVGDEQSIEASLSTFSAHLKNLAEILVGATDSSLVLIDELGSGTDPVEGAALGWAILEALTARGTMSIATTHLGTLKELASQVEGVVNASLQFDDVALAPTYRLIKGVPGRSYGISIARRLNLPEAVVARAEERLPQQERDMATLIEQLEKKEAELSARDRETAAIREDARERIADIAKRERTVRERERAAERESRAEARRYLLDARAEIDRTIKSLRKQTPDAIDRAAHDARRRTEELAAKQQSELERLDREEANVRQRPVPGAPRPTGAVAVGDTVTLATLGGKTGRLLELRDGEALVAVGVMKMTVPIKSLSRSTAAPSERAVAYLGDMPELEVATEIDLRGMRADEAESLVMQSLDAAIRADLKSLRIIHGKGTGVLREIVTEMLKKESRIRSYRIGTPNEGGAGVTFVDL
jgi:DNA mismatch repair protein MutS2